MYEGGQTSAPTLTALPELCDQDKVRAGFATEAAPTPHSQVFLWELLGWSWVQCQPLGTGLQPLGEEPRSVPVQVLAGPSSLDVALRVPPWRLPAGATLGSWGSHSPAPLVPPSHQQECAESSSHPKHFLLPALPPAGGTPPLQGDPTFARGTSPLQGNPTSARGTPPLQGEPHHCRGTPPG